MRRTYVVTGPASGIGAPTAVWIGERGGRVIGCDLRHAILGRAGGADIVADPIRSQNITVT